MMQSFYEQSLALSKKHARWVLALTGAGTTISAWMLSAPERSLRSVNAGRNLLSHEVEEKTEFQKFVESYNTDGDTIVFSNDGDMDPFGICNFKYNGCNAGFFDIVDTEDSDSVSAENEFIEIKHIVCPKNMNEGDADVLMKKLMTLAVMFTKKKLKRCIAKIRVEVLPAVGHNGVKDETAYKRLKESHPELAENINGPPPQFFYARCGFRPVCGKGEEYINFLLDPKVEYAKLLDHEELGIRYQAREYGAYINDQNDYARWWPEDMELDLSEENKLNRWLFEMTKSYEDIRSKKKTRRLLQRLQKQ